MTQMDKCKHHLAGVQHHPSSSSVNISPLLSLIRLWGHLLSMKHNLKAECYHARFLPVFLWSFSNAVSCCWLLKTKYTSWNGGSRGAFIRHKVWEILARPRYSFRYSILSCNQTQMCQSCLIRNFGEMSSFSSVIGDYLCCVMVHA